MTALNNRYPAIQGEAEFEDEAEWENEFEDELAAEQEYEFEFEAEQEAEGELEAEFEAEFEAELEEEAEGFVNPVRRIYRDAELMAHLSGRAARADSEAEAEAFIGALVPLAARLIPRAANVMARHAPTLIRAATRIGGQLLANPGTRQLVPALPVILQRTAQSLADQSADGSDVDAGTVLDTLGDIATRVLAPGSRQRAVRAVNTFDRRYRRRQQWERSRVVARRAARRPMSGTRRGRRH